MHTPKTSNITIRLESTKTQSAVETKPENKSTRNQTASKKEFKAWLAKTLEEDSEILDELAKH